MNTWLKSLAVGLAAGLLVFFLSKSKADKSMNRTFTAEYAVKASADTITKQPFSLSGIAAVLDMRLKKAGYSYAIQEEKPDKLYVTLKGLEDTAGPGRMLTAPARLQFRDMYTMNDVAIVNMLTNKIFSGEEVKADPKQEIKKEDEAHKKDTSLADGLPEDRSINIVKTGGIFHLLEMAGEPYSSARGNMIYPAAVFNVKEKDKEELLRFMNSAEVKAITPPDLQVLFGPESETGHKSKEKKLGVYFIRTFGMHKARIENEDIVEAFTNYNQTGQIQVTINMRAAGKRTWAEMTARNVDKPIAMIVDDEVVSAPNVNEPITEGTSVITGNYTIDQAKTLAASILSPKLPCKVEIATQKIIPEKKGLQSFRVFLIPFIAFLVFTALAFIIFNSLKTT